jgi:hypothetical protein
LYGLSSLLAKRRRRKRQEMMDQIYMIIDTSPEQKVWSYLNSSGEWNVLDRDREYHADCEFSSSAVAKQILEQFCGGDIQPNLWINVVKVLGRTENGARIFRPVVFE